MLKNIFDILSHGYTQSDMKKELFSYERTRSADQELNFFLKFSWSKIWENPKEAGTESPNKKPWHSVPVFSMFFQKTPILLSATWLLSFIHYLDFLNTALVYVSYIST